MKNPQGSYSAYYKERGYKALVVATNTGHICYVSQLYDNVKYDGEIFATEFPNGLPKKLRGRVAGDLHFRTCDGVVVPTSLPELKKCIAARNWDALTTALERGEEVAILRTRIEHRFNSSFLGSWKALQNPHNRAGCPPSGMRDLLLAAAAVTEAQMKVRHGNGGPYTPARIAEREAKIQKADNVLNRYGQAMEKYTLSKAKELFEAVPQVRAAGRKRAREEEASERAQAAVATANAARKSFNKLLGRAKN